MEYLQYLSHIEQENKGGTARMMKYGVPLFRSTKVKVLLANLVPHYGRTITSCGGKGW